ncbi:uncharacterized protein PV07_08583 [Cladophialophora immunda]|uniref:Uncharacterized protein n=1 Tax=Cladophialophora immunda TaxID=569365 RepID=A0A0D1ZCE2_9EURO|nr:uncharacterized protein PV07_08583 [Cladophialophora immunda]KIW25406.1 hypothetical protein PV07_08583 [Cladophialophora immunda]
MDGGRENIGMDSDGWAPSEEYDSICEKNKFIRQQVIDRTEDDEERQLSLEHYRFDDHNVDEINPAHIV